MTAREIAKLVDKTAPEAVSERLVRDYSEYDNTGLLIEAGEEDISRVLVVLDVDEAAVEEAVRQDCGMIVSHHPVIYRAIRSLNPEDGEQRNYLALVRAGISVYSAHLSLDGAKNGINAAFARELGLENAAPLMPVGEGEGLLFAGDFSGNMDALCEAVRRVTKAPMRVSHNAGRAPLRVAVLNGGGADVDIMRRARTAGCNTLVSGDAKHHAFVWAKNNRFNLIDAGHFETEHFYLKHFAGALNGACPAVTFVLSGQTAPYVIFGGRT